MEEDFLIRLCNIQFETLDYIDRRSRSANRFVGAEDLAKALKIKRGTADGRLKRYCAKGWLKEQIIEGRRMYLLRMEGLKRLQWLLHMQTKIPPQKFKEMLEAEGVELPDWMSGVK
jgi:DNA-binding MarR family transcriptional regulator